MTKLKKIIIQANPIRLNGVCHKCNKHLCYCIERGSERDWYKGGRSIRLADVFLAVNKEYHRGDLEIDVNWASDNLVFTFKGKEAWWDLTKDLDGQKPEVLKFLEDLLIK